jgi:hypothetical protein
MTAQYARNFFPEFVQLGTDIYLNCIDAFKIQNPNRIEFLQNKSTLSFALEGHFSGEVFCILHRQTNENIKTIFMEAANVLIGNTVTILEDHFLFPIDLAFPVSVEKVTNLKSNCTALIYELNIGEEKFLSTFILNFKKSLNLAEVPARNLNQSHGENLAP